MSLFSTELQSWYLKNYRDLPWRKTKDPYLIWLSEVILQQTRVQQGMSYFLKFSEQYPTLSALAQADEQEVLNLWQGLGYYSRARNMLKTAKFISENRDGVFPNSYEELLRLPGVGKYTAAAVASFAFDLPHAVVDGNVYRILSRYYNSEEFIDTTSGQKFYQSLADELLDKIHPALHNQAIMELGALVCTPKNPNCEQCPLNTSCASRPLGKWDSLPRKKSRITVKNRTLNYLVHEFDDQLLLQKRGTSDIWANMFEFPCIEGKQLPDEIHKKAKFLKTLNHKLTHQNLEVNFFRLDDISEVAVLANGQFVKMSMLRELPLPRVIEKFLEQNYDHELRV